MFFSGKHIKGHTPKRKPSRKLERNVPGEFERDAKQKLRHSDAEVDEVIRWVKSWEDKE